MRGMFRVRRNSLRSATVALLALVVLAPPLVQAQTAYQFELPAQALADSLRAVGRQTSTNVLFEPEIVKGRQAPQLRAQLTISEAVRRLLDGTQLTTRQASADTLIVERAPIESSDEKVATPSTSAVSATNAYTRLAQADDPSAAGGAAGQEANPERVELEEISVIPEILVVGSKILNMDLPRSRDDTQPYVVYDRATLEQSAATNLEDFFRQRLTMNTTTSPSAQFSSFNTGNTSSVNLRGLGTNQTLILIDGHRVSGGIQSGNPTQADINGIPIAAIERVEVLPTTASGIYGGGATGGVINIVLRRDYSGVEMKATYGNTFDSDVAQRRIDMAAGFTLEEGNTNVLLAASYSDQNQLLVGERDIVQKHRAAIIRNLGGDPTNLANTTVPPLGATTNIRSASGAPLFGPGTANITFVSPGYAGGGGLAPLQANAGRYNLDLADTAQISNTGGGGAREGLYSAPTVQSASMTVRRRFNSRVEMFVDLGASTNESAGPNTIINTQAVTLPASAPTNPFGQAVRLTIPVHGLENETIVEQEERRAVGGVIFQLARGWSGEFDYSWNESRSSYFAAQVSGLSPAFTAAVNSGALDLLRDSALIDFSSYYTGPTYGSPAKARVDDYTLRFTGPLMQLPAGPLALSGSVSYRKESYGESTRYSPTSLIFFPSRSQSVKAAYLETRIPLIDEPNARRLAQLLEFSLAARYDDYTVNGVTGSIQNPTPTSPIVRVTSRNDTVNPTVGLRYQPVRDVTLRASFGRGFLPPSVGQLAPLTANGSGFSDPRRGGTAIDSFVAISGGNPDLQPETSESWSGGLILTPSFVPGLRISADYTRITKTDNIATLSVQQMIDNEALFPGRIVRGGNLPGDPAGWAGVITLLDNSGVNISEAEVEAYDLALDYDWQTRFGSFSLFAAATVMPHYLTRLLPTSDEVENAGVGGGSQNTRLKLRTNGGLRWSRGGWNATWVTRYYDSYYVIHPDQSTFASLAQRQGGPRVSSQVYHDLFVGYRFSTPAFGALDFLRETEIQFGVRNVFNKEPPLDVNNTRYLYSMVGDPRLASYYLSLKQSF